jgi:predicted transcriptional regulator
MVRDLQKRQESLARHKEWSLNHFNKLLARMDENIEDKRRKNKPGLEQLILERSRMKFQFDSSKTVIHFGKCVKFDIEVDFIPNTCQLHTQQCFKHRKDE